MKIQEVDAEEGEDEDRSAMGGPVDFGGVFKAHIWQPAAALASPRSWIPSLSRFHFGQAPPVINQPCVIAHSLVAPVGVAHIWDLWRRNIDLAWEQKDETWIGLV